MLRSTIQRLLLLLLCQSVLMANAATPKQTTVTCKVYNNTGSAVFLYKVENGEAVSLGFRRPGKMDTCMFTFPAEKEGVYFIRKGGPHMPAYNHVIYLKPGDDKSVDIYTSNKGLDFDSCEVHRPNDETVLLQRWTNWFNTVCKLGPNKSKRDGYIAAYNKLLVQAAELKRKTPGGNHYFKNLFALKLNADIQYVKAAAFFCYGERMNAALDSVAARSAFYQSLGQQQFKNAGILQSEHGLALLKYNLGYQLFYKYGTQEQMLAAPFVEKMKMISNDTLRAIFALDRMRQITNYEQFKAEMHPFKALFASNELRQAYQQKEDALTVYAKGAPAYNFTLNDTKDQLVSLSDFKGKVVVVDVWAMWCGPCLAEKPYFQAVEEAFKDRNDIVFIGVSHDGLSRKEVWKQFVARKGYKNIELIANYDEAIGKYYKIEGIPRFMIFDKEGKIVTVDAPRPSNPAFKKLIEQTLNASSQRNVHFLSGSFSEKLLADVQLVKTVNNIARPVSDYKISPVNNNFAFAIPNDTGATYRLQVNIMKKEGRHPKLDKAFSLPLPINPGQNYTLKITPSAFNEAKKTGWELKQDKAAAAVAFISGRIMNFKLKSGMQVSLQSVENGAMITQNSVESTTDGSFEIACPVPQEGFYYLTTMRWRVRVYLKAADRLQLNIDHKTGKPTYLNASYENKVLYQWMQLINPITDYGYNLSMISTDSVTQDDYIRTHEKLQPAMAEFFDKMDKSNPQFVQAFKNAMDVDRQLTPVIFLMHKSQKKVKGFGSTPRDFNDVPAYYKQFIQPNKFSNASILRIGEARQFMNLYAKLNVSLLSKEERAKLTTADKLRLMMNTITNDTLKTFFFNDQMGQIEINNLSEFKEIFEPFQQYANMSPVKETYKGIYGLYSADTAFIGKSSYDFSLPDTSGKMVSMKDFKGKVVFIDVWATWCGPCRGQFPFLKEIEHEYADNKDIVFVGISLDKASVKDKWKEMIRKEQLGGIQLLDDVGLAFGRKYQVNAIPRFMLIDRQGRWIEIRCPMPSSKEDLKRYLDKALKTAL